MVNMAATNLIRSDAMAMEHDSNVSRDKSTCSTLIQPEHGKSRRCGRLRVSMAGTSGDHQVLGPDWTHDPRFGG